MAAACVLVLDQRGSVRRPFDWPGFGLSGGAVFSLLSLTQVVAREVVPWHLVVAPALAGFGLSALALRHFRRATHPMLESGAMRPPTFAVTVWGGSLIRAGVSAIPFLLPIT